MRLYRYEGKIFVEAESKRAADRKVGEAFLASAEAGDDEVVIPHLHPWTRLTSDVAARQECCGMLAPYHDIGCHFVPSQGVTVALEPVVSLEMAREKKDRKKLTAGLLVLLAACGDLARPTIHDVGVFEDLAETVVAPADEVTPPPDISEPPPVVAAAPMRKPHRPTFKAHRPGRRSLQRAPAALDSPRHERLAYGTLDVSYRPVDMPDAVLVSREDFSEVSAG